MKTKVLISFAVTAKLICFAVTAKLICVFVFAYTKIRFSHDAAHFSSSLFPEMHDTKGYLKMFYIQGLSIKYVDFPYNSGIFQYFKTKSH